MTHILKADKVTAQRDNDRYYDPFVTGISQVTGVRIIDCDALDRALKAGARYNEATRMWDHVPHRPSAR